MQTIGTLSSIVSSGTEMHIQLTCWEPGVSYPLTSSGLDYKGLIIPVTSDSIKNRLWRVDTTKPMTPVLVKRVLGTNSPVGVLLLDGTPVTYSRANGKNFDDANTGKTYTDSLVYIDTPDNRKYLESKAARQASKKQFIENTDLTRLLTFGFELETQQTEGLTYDNRKEGFKKNANNIKDKSQFIKQLADKGSSSPLAQVVAHLVENGNTDAVEAIANTPLSSLLDLIPNSSITPKMCLPHLEGMDVGQDGSVKGFEIRTIGGLDSATFKKRVADVMALKHEVNERCSFHIHVGSEVLELKKDPNTIGTMISYILGHNDIPTSVRNRWKDNNANYFCRPNIDGKEKESFIRVHPQGTLEFRCFGNINNVADAETCHRIAVEAIKYAMINTVTDDNTYNSEWKKEVDKTMSSGKPSKILLKFKEYKEKIAAFEARVAAEKEQLLNTI